MKKVISMSNNTNTETENVIMMIPCTFNMNIDEMLEDIDNIIEKIVDDRLGGRYNIQLIKRSDPQSLFTRKYELIWESIGKFKFKLECIEKELQVNLTIDKMSNISFNAAKDIIMQLEIGVDINRKIIFSHFTSTKLTS